MIASERNLAGNQPTFPRLKVSPGNRYGRWWQFEFNVFFTVLRETVILKNELLV